MNDSELLQAWANRRDEAAFAELVRRHLDLVRASAHRQIGASPLADDVTQAVFLVLARKAGTLGTQVVLSGWLFRTTRFVAARALRAEQRRTHHENVAAMHPVPNDTAALPEHWKDVEPHLDAGLAALSTADRDALLLRFFEGKPLRAVGEQLGVSEETAKKRVSRAVEKLRAWLAGRGVGLTAAGLVSLLENLPLDATPAGLAGQVATVAMANTGGAAVATLAAGATRDWLLAQVRQGLPWVAAALLLVTAGVLALLPEPEMTTPATVERVPGGPTEPPDTSSGTGPGSAAVLPAQPGPSRILLNVRSAADNRPLAAQVVASFSGRQHHLETKDLATDANGNVEIPAADPRLRSLTLWVSAPGHSPVTLSWKHHEFVEPILVYQAELEPGHRLEGVVQDETGRPVAGAKILFDGPGIDVGERQNIEFHSRLSQVTSDTGGRFWSDQLPLLRGNHGFMSYTVTHPDFVRARIELDGPSSLGTPHGVTLHRGAFVSSRVVGPDDAPIPGATVEEVDPSGGPSRSTTTSTEGQFSLGPFSSEPVHLEVSAEGFQRSRQTFMPGRSTNEPIVRLLPEDVSRNEQERGMDATQTVRLAGTVIDFETGEPLPRFRIRLNEHRGATRILVGDGHQGRFDWPMEMASHDAFSLEAEADGYESMTSDVRPARDGTHNFQFRLRRGGVASGRVVDPDGRPVAGALVGLNGLGFGFIVRDDHAFSGNGAPQTITDSTGMFSIGLSLNTESLVVVHEAGMVQVPIAQARRATLVLRSWGTIEGVVLTAGQPTTGQRVLLRSHLPESNTGLWPVALDTTVTSDAQGRFRFDHVPPGAVAVSRSYKFSPGTTGPIGIGAPQRVEVPAGGVVEVTLATTGRAVVGRLQLSQPVTGHQWPDDLQTLEAVRPDLPPVTSEAPHPTPDSVAQARAQLRRDAQIRRLFPDIQPDGSFRIEDVPAGTYLLHLRASVPPNDQDDENQHFFRPLLGKREVPVVVPAGDFNDPPVDLGTILIPVKSL